MLAWFLPFCRQSAALLLILNVAPAQLQRTGAGDGLDRLIVDAGRLLAAAASPASQANRPTTGHDVARLVLGHLRLADPPAARERLLRGCHDLLDDDTEPGSQDACWLIAAHTWYARCTRDHGLLPMRMVQFERLLTDTGQRGLPDGYAEAAMQVHARYCLGILTDLLDRERCPLRWQSGPPSPLPGGDHACIATERLLQLECATWQPGRGHYRPRRTHGELASPVAADASLLVPCSAGMLLATGDRLGRHLERTLQCAASGEAWRWQAALLPQQLDALCLVAASQLGASTAMATYYAELVNQRPSDPVLAAMQLDAALYAITGMRIAIGAGIDETWLRLAPWLPPGRSQLVLHGVLAAGRLIRLELRRGPGEDGLHVCVTMTAANQLGALPIVVGNQHRQFLAHLVADEPFVCELPPRRSLPAQLEPQHEPPQRSGIDRRIRSHGHPRR